MNKLVNTRKDLVHLLPQDAKGLELGVAKGAFSLHLIKNHNFSEFYGIDMWRDHHDMKEYFSVLQKVSNYPNYYCIRSKFEESLCLFSDNYFDFIYIDGYAHTGQDGGKTLDDWYPKLKIGGIFSGHDYSQKYWPKTKEVVDNFCENRRFQINITQEEKYPSWYIINN